MGKYSPTYLKEQSPQKQGRKQEKKACQTINSGTYFFNPGDLTVKEDNEDYLIDVKKVATQKCYQLSLKDIDKLYKQAIPKTPAFLIYIGPYLVTATIRKV